MAKKRILIINTFPIANAETGGQKREEALVAAMGSVMEAKYVGVFYREHYRHFSPDDIALPAELDPVMRSRPHTGDIVCGEAIFENAHVKGRMTAVLKSFKPDIIQIEQVFPYFGMKRLLAELDIHPKLVFSSHNVEAPHKREILESVGMPKAEIETIVKSIEDVELDLTRSAELVIACTEADRHYYVKHGAKKAVLARNGMARIETTEETIDKWEQYFAEQGVAKRAVFVGSAHPPNWVGFERMVGYGVGFLPFDSRLLLVGGICDYFERTASEDYNPQHRTFWHRVMAMGRPDNDDLAALIMTADVIILPITEGGGSNLKTAEAVLSGKPVVGTTHAFRSFEELQDLPNIHLADTMEDFHAAIVRAMTTPPAPRTAAQQHLAESVLWENCLAAAVKEVSAL